MFGYEDEPRVETTDMPASARQVGGNHYLDMPIQPWDFILANNIPFLEGSAIAYICRHRTKEGAKDIRKAIHFLEKLLEHEYNSSHVRSSPE